MANIRDSLVLHVTMVSGDSSYLITTGTWRLTWQQAVSPEHQGGLLRRLSLGYAIRPPLAKVPLAARGHPTKWRKQMCDVPSPRVNG